MSRSSTKVRQTDRQRAHQEGGMLSEGEGWARGQGCARNTQDPRFPPGLGRGPLGIVTSLC